MRPEVSAGPKTVDRKPIEPYAVTTNISRRISHFPTAMNVFALPSATTKAGKLRLSEQIPTKIMSTLLQFEANKANAQASTGPRTEAGKERASRNALKHGLTSNSTLIPGEDPAEFDKFRSDFIAFYEPKGIQEENFVNELIHLQWRLNRIPKLEAGILSDEEPDLKALNNISLLASRTKRQFSATLKEFQALKKARIEKFEHDRENAISVRRGDLLENRETDLSPFGFDFTIEYLDHVIYCENVLLDAHIAIIDAGGKQMDVKL